MTMITTTFACRLCQSTNVKLYGHNCAGTQRYHCNDCGTTRVLKPKKALLPEVEQAMERSYLERNSLRATARIFGVSHGTVFNKVKKKARDLPAFKTTIVPATKDDVLEVDELFTFIQMKVNQIRIWIVQCRRTRQILSFFIGDGSMESCKKLWRKLPSEYLGCKSFSDLWRSYNCIPATTHQKVGKETGQTNHIERCNNTLRQRISRLVRKTLSFSKKEYMLNLHFKLFALSYNQEITTNF
jgi:insertion element IS1 protein InsB